MVNLVDLVRRCLGIILGSGSATCIIYGFLLFISDIQAIRMPDGYPLESNAIILALVILGVLAAAAAVAVWPDDKSNPLLHAEWKNH
jgi:hypothetical protein